MKPIHEMMRGYTKQEFLRNCMTSFKFFGENVLSLHVEPFHEEWANLFYSYRRSCIVAFRGSGKSTIVGTAAPLWLMAFDSIHRRQPERMNKPVKIMVISPSLKQSKKIIRDVRGYINRVEFLHTLLYPDVTWRGGLMWTKTEMETKNGCQMFCQAYTENMRSEHVNYILVDEGSLLNDLSIFDRALIPMASLYPRNICVVGTPMRANDLIARCRTPGSGYYVSEYPVYRKMGEDDQGNISWGDNQWPWRYSDEELEMKRKELGELGFAREFLCLLVSDESRSIDPQWIVKSYAPGSVYGDPLKLDTRLNETGRPVVRMVEGKPMDVIPYRVTGTDLAMSQYGDWSVSITLEEHTDSNGLPDGRWLIKHMSRRRGMSMIPHVKWIERIHRTFQPAKHVIDKSQFGMGLIDLLRVEQGIPCDPFKFTPDNRKEIIGKVIQFFESGKYIIPRDPNDPYTINMTDHLIHEASCLIITQTNTGMETFKTVCTHDDCVMALAMATSCIPSRGTARLYYRSA